MASRKTKIVEYPWHLHLARQLTAALATVLFSMVVVISTMALYSYHDMLLDQGRTQMALYVNLSIAIQIQIFNALWDWLAVKLTDFTNCRTDSEYVERLVLMAFLSPARELTNESVSPPPNGWLVL